jgi:hypothetical protein
MMDSNLPPEFQPLLDELAETPEHVKAMWRYAIVLAMIDDEKARVMGTRQEGGQVLLSVRTVAGDEFEIVRPPMSEDSEKELLSKIRAIMDEDAEDEG